MCDIHLLILDGLGGRKGEERRVWVTGLGRLSWEREGGVGNWVGEGKGKSK